MVLLRLYFRNEVATIEEHANGYALLTYHPGSRQWEQAQAILVQLAQLLALRGWFRVLLNQQRMQAFKPREAIQVAAFWQQRTQQWGHGICVACILAQDMFARITATAMRQELQGAGIIYTFFEDAHQAGSWLGQQQQAPLLTRSE